MKVEGWPSCQELILAQLEPDAVEYGQLAAQVGGTSSTLRPETNRETKTAIAYSGGLSARFGSKEGGDGETPAPTPEVRRDHLGTTGRLKPPNHHTRTRRVNEIGKLEALFNPPWVALQHRLV